jgi:VWFA-related protein
MRRLVLAGLVTLASTALEPAAPEGPAPLLPQAPAGTPAVAQTAGVTAARVAVDLVVRDKKGRLVRDLRASDLEVLEDGAPQEILSVRLVDTIGGARTVPDGRPAAPAAAPAAPPTEDHPLYLAFLFDRLSPQARRTAHDAAIEWLEGAAPPTRQVGVFRVDQRLETLASFTADPAAAREAVGLILRSTPTQFHSASDRERLRALRQSLLAVSDPDRQSVQAGGSPAAVPGPLGAESSGLEVARSMDALRGARPEGLGPHSSAWGLLRVEMGMLEAAEALERDQQGLATLNAILALVNGLKTAPGRKAIVFFSEGLVLPPRVTGTLRTIVAEANRGGVTFYAADAAGLRTVSSASETRRDLASIAQVLENPDSAKPGELMKAIERNEDILRSDPTSGLSTLARETGGFLVTDTNSIARSLQVAEEDLASYYLLEYAPANELWDGRFRRIEVKVGRPGVHVQARQGYFAVRTAMPTPLLDYESPVLAALEMAPRANDLAFRTAVVQMPDQADESAVPVLVEVAGDVPTLDLDAKEKRYRQDFTVLVLVRDEGGRVVRKLSRRFATAGPLEKADEARRGRILVLRETWLPPGRYTVETAVQDAASGRLGVQRTPLEIPAAAEQFRVGSLVLVGHAAPRGEDAPESAALVAQGMQLFPSAAATVSASGGRPLPFFLVASPAPGRNALRAGIELRQGETAVFSAPADFVPAVGRTTLLGGVPLEGIPPGAYELRVTVADGVDKAVRWAKVTIAP